MYELTTAYGDRYRIHHDGAIERCDGQWKPDARRWRMRGVIPVYRRTLEREIPLAEIDSITEWTYKNGKPRYAVVDVDHGTVRVWGNHIYHGIASVRKIT